MTDFSTQIHNANIFLITLGGLRPRHLYTNSKRGKNLAPRPFIYSLVLGGGPGIEPGTLCILARHATIALCTGSHTGITTKVHEQWANGRKEKEVELVNFDQGKVYWTLN